MNGKHHFSFSLYTLIILSTILWHYKHYSLISLERCGFWFLVVTIYLNPDADTQSRPSNNLGIFKYIFLPMEHRKTSHNPFAWAILGIIFGYFGYIPEAIGLVTAALSHIVPDKIVTGVRLIVPKWIRTGFYRIVPKWIRKSVGKVF